MTGKETVQTIGEFFDRVCPPLAGRVAGVRAQALKLIEEAVEHAIAQGCTPMEVAAASAVRVTAGAGPQYWEERRPTPHTAGKELGDCCVVIGNICHRGGYDPGAETDACMKLNRARTWAATAEGKAQHVELETA